MSQGAVWINKQTSLLFVVTQMYWDRFILYHDGQSAIIVSESALVKYYTRLGDL